MSGLRTSGELWLAQPYLCLNIFLVCILFSSVTLDPLHDMNVEGLYFIAIGVLGVVA